MSTSSTPRTDASDAAALLRAIRLFLLVLVCGDLLYIAMHVGHLTMPALSGMHFSIETDRGLSEFYQYTKQLWLALCLAIAFVNRRHLVLLAWAGFFAFLLFDDALQVHERVGDWFGRRFGLPGVAGLRPDHVGELIVAAIVGATLLALLAAAWWRDRLTAYALDLAARGTGAPAGLRRLVFGHRRAALEPV